ncbi:MAG: right-handed parallel beta-helix repeat-containing protein [Actinomycetota bacterium]|nr:right-handed parallel beta-helix repeat-containing protein [Actinomycetota bacterium]
MLDHVEVRRAGPSWGKAIQIVDSSPTITNSTIRESTYMAIHVSGESSPDIADNVLNGGGFAVYYGSTAGKTLDIDFHDNVVEKFWGSAAVFVEPSSGPVVATSLGGNLVTNNSSTQAIYYNGGPNNSEIPPDIASNTVFGNTGGASTNQVAFAGALNKSATWETPVTAPLYLMGTLKVPGGITLTMKPGITLHGGTLEVLGTLKAEGTAEAPVTFKSATESGTWGGIVFKAGSGASVLDHVEVRRAGPSWGKAIQVIDSSPTITHSLIRESTYTGIHVSGESSPEIAHNTISGGSICAYYGSTAGKTLGVNFHDNVVEKCWGSAAVFVEPSSGPITATSLGGNLVTNNSSTQAIYYNGGPNNSEIPPDIASNTVFGNTGGASTNQVAFAGVLNKPVTWETPIAAPLHLMGKLKIPSGITLTMKPGVTLHGGSLEVLGTLKAEGTAEAPVTFKSATESGTWGGIVFKAGSGASVLDHVEVRRAGPSWGKGIEIVDSSPTITNSTIRESTYMAVHVSGNSSPVIANNIFSGGGFAVYYGSGAGKTLGIDFHDNLVEKFWGSAAVFVEPSSGPVTATSLGDNIVTNNSSTQAIYYNGGPNNSEIPPDIASNTVFGNTGGASTNQVAFAGALNKSATWEPSITSLHLEGTLAVSSGATLRLNPGIVLHGGWMKVQGTLKAEGEVSKPVVFEPRTATGNCGSIKLEPGSGSSVLDHVEIYRCNAGSGLGAVEVKGASPRISNSTIRANSPYAIRVTESGSPKIEWNRFRGNSGGLSYSGTGKLAAPNNDWGCASGPQPAGCGDSVTTNIEWKPAAQLPEQNGHCRGEESQCGEGADPVILATGDLSYSHRDLLLTNKSDVPLEMTRAYNSGSAANTGLGPGWAQTGLASATELASGAVLVLQQDGRQDLFYKTESGYKAPPGVTSTLAKVEGAFHLTTLEGTVYRFESSGRITSITDDHGLKTTYGYDANGRLATITDSSSQTLTFAYNGSNRITSVKDSTGREVKYTYSGAGDLTTVTDPLGGVTEYTYDSAHRLKTIKDPRGNVILKNTYDAQGRVIEQRDGLENLWKLEYKENETVVTEPEGGKVTYGFDGQNRVVSEKDQLGHTTATSYDAAGNVDEVIRPGGAKWQLGHDAAGNLTSVVDPGEGERSYEYDSKNRLTGFTDARGSSWSFEWSGSDLTKITDPEEGETILAYNESGQPSTVTDANGHKAEFSYDSRGNTLSVTDPLGHKTSFEYSNRNHLIAETKPGLKAETFSRNALGELLSQTTPEGHTTQYVYDANGRPTQITDPAKGVWKIAYNAMERPITYTDPLEQQIKISYNGNLKPIKVINRRGKETTYKYDLANRLIEVNEPEGENWSFGYDSRGNRTSLTDPREYETTYEYDLLDRMTKVEEPLSVATDYGYNANGDITSVLDPRGNSTTYSYDELGRLTQIAQPLERATSFAYDDVGNLLSRTTPAGVAEYDYDVANRLTEINAGETASSSFGYDNADRLTSAMNTQGKKIEIGYNEDGLVSSINDGRGQSITRTYDPLGNLTKQVDGRGTLQYGYDGLGRLTSLTDPQGKTSTFAYNPEGGLTEVKRPGGIITTNAYDNAGRLAETLTKAGELGSVLEALEYGYDSAGNVTSRTDARLEQETTYAYDALNRLTSFDPPGEGSTSYGYDAAGNRTSAAGITYSFNALNQVTGSSDGATYGYDGAGRLASMVSESGETLFEWDALDRLTGVEGGSESIGYTYDALDRLVERTDGMGTQLTHYGDLTDLATYDATGEGEITTSYVQSPEGLLGQRSGESTSYPLSDAHGDITALANAAGEVTSRQSYDPWGAQLSGPTLEMGYLGEQERRSDPATGLIQMGARVYSPALGSFLSEDPVLGKIGLGITANRYPYVWNNPLTLYDLDGRFPSISGAGDAVGGALDSGWDATAGGRDFIGVAGNGNGGAAGDFIEGSIDYAEHVEEFWSDRYGDFVKNLKESCDTSFEQRAWDNFVITNKAVNGILAPTLSSFPINKWGGVAAKYRTTGAFEWLWKSRNLSELPRVARASAVSWIYTSIAWEAGVGIGSLARSGLAEIYC